MKKSDIKKLLTIGAVVTAAATTTAIVMAKRHKHKLKIAEKTESLSHQQAYITGGGISAFASAFYLVRDCGFKPANIHIFTNTSYNCGNSKTGYICRRGKIINELNSMNLLDLMSNVNSLDIPDLTVCDELLNINRTNSRLRNITLIDSEQNVLDASKIRIDSKSRKTILSLMQSKTDNLRSIPLCDVFDICFFDSDFWKLISASYGFSDESSAYEFITCLLYMNNILSGTIPADFDRYEEFVEPLREHLKNEGVDIRERAIVTDINFNDGKADAVHFVDSGIRKTFYLNDGDLCIMPTDEMDKCESIGNFNSPAEKTDETPYQLWENIAEKNPEFPNPSQFFSEDELDMSEEFTITLSSRLFPELIDKVTCGALGNDGIIVLDNSSWKMTLCAIPSTHFKNQNEDVTVLWGTATNFTKDGEHCGKPMTQCSGAEILYELVSCFNLDEVWDDISETVINVIPCRRKYAKSLLKPVQSKFEIIPTGIENFAVSGDFAQSENNTVFSEEYSVSTARTATYKLTQNKGKIFESKPCSCTVIKSLLKKAPKKSIF